MRALTDKCSYRLAKRLQDQTTCPMMSLGSASSKSTGIKGKSRPLDWFGRRMTWRPLIVEPANHRHALRARRDDLAVQLARIGDGAIDGHDRAGGKDRMHCVVDQAGGDRLAGIGKPLPVGQHVAFKRERDQSGRCRYRRAGRARTATNSEAFSLGRFSADDHGRAAR